MSVVRDSIRAIKRQEIGKSTMPFEANVEYLAGRVNYIVNADATLFMEKMDPDSIDLTVTSPPYDDLRI